MNLKYLQHIFFDNERRLKVLCDKYIMATKNFDQENPYFKNKLSDWWNESFQTCEQRAMH